MSGAGQEELLTSPSAPASAWHVSPDGRFLVFERNATRAGTNLDLWVLPLSGGGKETAFLATPFSESEARFSPDGRWLAYTSNESGRGEVYVTSFPGREGKWQISSGGGVGSSLAAGRARALLRCARPSDPFRRDPSRRGVRGRSAPASFCDADVSEPRGRLRRDGRRPALPRQRAPSAGGARADHARGGLARGAEEKVTLPSGSRLGPYEILAPIGAGGMGEVYRARDTRLDRVVAIKVLPSRLSSSEEARQRFEREAKTISQLSHPHICALYDVGREGETEYLVMELLEGETLGERLAKGALPLEQTLRYGVEIADALDKAHRQGIVHRDLKPANVMLTKSGVKLLDFGLAKAMAPATAQGEPDRSSDAAGPDAGRHDPRDVPVHGAGAARGQGGRRADGHLRARGDALRDGDGEEGVFGDEPGVSDHRDHVERSGADLFGATDVAAGARSHREDLPRKGSRRSLAERGGRPEARSSGSPRVPRRVSRRRLP